jgi:inward rectifier potassium channel
LIEVEVQVVLSKVELINGSHVRKFYQLELERNSINFLSMSWTIVHPISENSPLHGCTEQELKESDAEFMILVKGFDDTFAQTIHARSSYKDYEIEWGAKFKSTYDRGKNGKTVVDLSTLGAYEKVPLPVTPVSQEATPTESTLFNPAVQNQE